MSKIVTCLVCSEEKDHYGRGMCRPCYRKATGESRKYAAKVAADPVLQEKSRERHRKYYRTHLKGTEEYKERQRITQRRLYHAEGSKRREYLRKWKDSLPVEKKRAYHRRDNATAQFGNYLLVTRLLEHYGNACAMCTMTEEQSHMRWGARLSIHHIDGNGRNVPRDLKNNDFHNLIPLCKSCHQRVERRKEDVSHLVKPQQQCANV